MSASILVVEDSRTQAEVYRGVLDRAGYAVSVVASAERALAKLLLGTFDLVITDVGLPGMDGFELCVRIRDQLGLQDLPVLVQTADDDPKLVLRGLEAGASGFMRKNAGPAALVARIAAALAPTTDAIQFMDRTYGVRSDRRAVVSTLVGAFEDLVKSRRVEAVLDAVPVAVVTLDRNGATRVVNAAARALLAGGALPDRLVDMASRCRLTGADEGLAELTCADVPVVAGARAVLDAGGAVDEVVLTLTAITELYRERERAIASELAARRASEAKSAFLANMSHELRTPLNAILGYAELLLEAARDKDATDEVQDLERILSSGQHLLGLINDILDLSKVEAGKMTVQSVTYAVDALVRDVGVVVEPLARRNGNRLVVEVAPEVGTASGDATKVRQCLLNLLGNACKFTSNGTVGIRAQLGVVGGEEWLRFVVHDTGIGMTDEQLGRVFEEFTQADASTTRRFGGTGLGLTLTRRFATLLGGRVEVESEPGRGSRFTLLVPANAQRVVPAALTVAVDPEEDVVLVVGDDTGARDPLRRALERDGFGVVLASTAAQALDLARRHRPVAVAVDVGRSEGWEAIAAIRADGSTAPAWGCALDPTGAVGASWSPDQLASTVVASPVVADLATRSTDAATRARTPVGDVVEDVLRRIFHATGRAPARRAM